jgi:hypothetical protein
VRSELEQVVGGQPDLERPALRADGGQQLALADRMVVVEIGDARDSAVSLKRPGTYDRS